MQEGFTSITVTGQLLWATAVSVNLLAYHAVLLGHSSKRKDITEESESLRSSHCATRTWTVLR